MTETAAAYQIRCSVYEQYIIIDLQEENTHVNCFSHAVNIPKPHVKHGQNTCFTC